MKVRTMRCIPLLLVLALFNAACSKSGAAQPTPTPPPVTPPPTTPGSSEVTAWLTTGDKASLLSRQSDVLNFGTASNTFGTVSVDSTIAYQTVDGFGYTLTEGSAYLINKMNAADRTNLLTELFGNGTNSIGVNYLRVGIGATDLSTSVYSYNDLPAGSTDVTLANFSLAKDMTDVIPVLQQVVAINPAIKILATPWSPPVWMKDNGSSIGGSLLPAYYSVYANYFVKYIQGMKALGITIDAITPQNEPLHPGNNPSMYMTAAQQATFIKNNLAPAFAAAALTTKIIVYDHNCDRTDYPLDVLNDPAARAVVDGSAFHLYAGDISALTTVHNASPTKNVYFTEQYTASSGSFSGDLRWHLRNVVIGSMRNWSRVALEWNLANDPSMAPFTPGGCTVCLGAITINGSSVTRNVAYYIIAHASKFIPAGSTRIYSSNYGNIHSAAFLRADGKKVLLVVNDEGSTQQFNIKFKDKWFATSLAAGAVATYVW